MKNLNKYTKFFQPTECYDDKFTHKFIQSVKIFYKNSYKKLSSKTEIKYSLWILPYDRPLREDYYNILFIFAKLCKVKLMWRNLITQDPFDIYKGLWVIGVQENMELWMYIANYFFKGHFTYETHIKNKWNNSCSYEIDLEKLPKGQNYIEVKAYASQLLEIQRDTIYSFIKKILVPDLGYTLWLENVIKEQFKLDYKNYNTDVHEYYHAISTKFCHKRMLL